MAEAVSGLPALIEKLKKIKKKPEDWVFVPRRKKFDKCRVMLENGESVLVSDGSGGFRPSVVKKPVSVVVSQVKSIDKAGNLIGGYRPKAEADWTAQEVLDDLIEMSLNPACEVVPYEAREVGKEAKDAEMNLIDERRRRMEAEDKLKALEEGGRPSDAARIKELEAALEKRGK